MKDKEYIKHIFSDYIEGDYTPEDLNLLLETVASEQIEQQEFEALIEKSLDNTVGLIKLDDTINRIGDATLHSLQEQLKPKQRPFKRLLYLAASIVALCGIGLAVYQFEAEDAATDEVLGAKESAVQDVLPGRNRAMISVAGAEELLLDDGQSAIEIGTDEIRYANGKELARINPTDSIQVRTPKGGQYQMTLSDGTKVWLNAGSSIQYPSQFGSSDRIVSLQGEAYFEVSKETGSAKRSFTVVTNRQKVQVLGTHFNVNAYADEATHTTTLFEGAVNVATASATKKLHPGQEAVLNNGALNVQVADLEVTLAWKNNMFIFNNTKLQDVMKVISRWYDVEIVYPDQSAINEVYAGSITRYENLSKVLRMLEKAGDTRFKLEGRRIVVMK